MSLPSSRFQGLAEFVETARSGSFTAAAATLGMTGSAAGKSVTKLEERLGIKLLHRTTRKLTLTADGEAYLATCLTILEQLDGAESGLASGLAVPVGRLRLDLPAAFGRRHIMPVLTELSTRHSQLDFSVMFTERTSDIIGEGIDLAVRIGKLNDETDLVARRLGTQRVVVCASPDYVAREGLPTSAEELGTRDGIIGWRRVSRPAWLMRSADGQSRTQEIRVRHELSDGESMLQAVLAGCGLCQLPTWLIAEHLRAGRLVTVLDEIMGGEMPIHAVWPRSKYMQPKLRVLIDALSRAALLDRLGFHSDEVEISAS